MCTFEYRIETTMKATEKIVLINKALETSGAAAKHSAKAEIINGKVLYSMVRLGIGAAKIRLTFKEILWMMNSEEARKFA